MSLDGSITKQISRLAKNGKTFSKISENLQLALRSNELLGDDVILKYLPLTTCFSTSTLLVQRLNSATLNAYRTMPAYASARLFGVNILECCDVHAGKSPARFRL